MRTLSRIFLLALFVPVFASAQSADLQATIRAALASDPRTNAMTAEQLDALALQLATGAQEQGMTPQDITWRPVESQPVGASQPGCSVFPQYFCVISDSFGFGWGDHTIPIWLFAAALMFLFIAGEMRYLHRRHLQALQAAPAPVKFTPPAPPLA